jgi:single-strand DNA-binding protein
MINVEFIGRLGADSEIRETKNGKKMVSFRVATDDFNGGERTTTWVNVMWTGDRAIKMQEHLKKGSHVDVRGVLRTSLYKTKAGESAISHDVFADRVDFVSSGSGTTQVSEAATTTGADFGKLKKQDEQAAVAAAGAASDAADDLPF